MSNSVLLFLMGPPVSVPSEFAALIQPILQEFCQGNCRDIQIADVSGPVHYLEDWMDVGSRTRRERRLGLRMVDPLYFHQLQQHLILFPNFPLRVDVIGC